MADAELGAAIVAVGRLRAAAPGNEAELVAALVALADRLQATGRSAAAIKALDEALTVSRRCRRRERALSQGGDDDDDDAATTLLELVALGQRLAAAYEARTEEMKREWATGVDGRTHTALMLEQFAAACTALGEVATWQRELERLQPEQHIKGLAETLRRQSKMLASLSQPDRALAGLTETLAYYRELVRERPDTFLPELAACLTSASHLQNSGRHADEAAALANEAVGIYRRLIAELPELASSVHAGLGDTLYMLGGILGGQQLYPRAVEVLRESVAIKRVLADQNTSVHLPGLISALHKLGLCLMNLYSVDEAVSFFREALDLRKTMGTPMDENGKALTDVVYPRNLGDYGSALCYLGRLDEAVAPISQAVAMFRSFERDHPGVYTRDLADALLNLATTYSQLGSHQKIGTLVDEALGHYQTLARAQPAVYRPELAKTALEWANTMAEAGDAAASVRILQNYAIPQLTALYAEHPVLVSPLSFAYSLLADELTLLGRSAEAAAALAMEARLLK